MTNLKPVIEGHNRFCGPAVLSIITGKSTDECADVIRSINGEYKIRGVYLTDLLKAASKLNFNTLRINTEGSSLFRALTELSLVDGIYIVTVPNHFVCIEVKDKQIYFCDNHTKEPIKDASSARLMQKVVAAYRVSKRTEVKLTERQNDNLHYGI